MAFKIASIDELRSIADTMSQYSDNTETETSKVVNALEQLDAIVSGQGVDESLNKLKENIKNNAENATQTLRFVSLFIKSQTASYSQNTENTSAALNNVQNALNSIVI